MLSTPDKNKIALSFKNEDISYQHLHNAIHQIASQFSIEKGDRVLVFSENSPQWVYSFYSIWLNNGILVPVDMFSIEEDVEHIINDCNPSFIFYSNNTKKVLFSSLKNTGLIINTINLDELTLNIENDETVTITPDDEDTAVIMYTSGTTGKPKGVMLSYKNINAVKNYLINDNYFSESDKVIAILPFHHILPLQGTIIVPLSAGSRTVIIDSLTSDAILTALTTYGITIFIGVPRLYRMLLDGVMKKINASFVAKSLFKLASLVNSFKFSKILFKKVQKAFGGEVRYCVCGGSKLDPKMVKDFKTLGFRLLDGYGLTETAPMIANNPIYGIKIGSVGKINPGIKVKIVDDEIVVKGPNVMQGYYNNQPATDEVLKDGWFYTGDKGYVGKDDYLYVTGRIKEIIVLSNGKNINPEEIEIKISNTFPLVEEIGVYEEGDGLGAIIVPNFSHAKKENIVNIYETLKWTAIDKYNNSVPAYRKFKKITVSKEELPKTKLGKLRRFMLPALALNKVVTKIDGKEPVFEEYKILKAYLSELGKHNVNAYDHIELDLGLDSLDKVEFLVYIEKTFGISLEDSQLAEFGNIEDIANHIQKNKLKINRENMNWKEILKEETKFNLPKRVILLTLFKWIFRPLSSLYFRLEVSGLENLPKDMACIIAPNHQSFMDGFMVASILKRKIMKKTYFFAKEKHFKSTFKKFIAGNSNVIIMNINKELKTSIQKIGSVLRNGKNMIIFPEGARSRDGQMMPFKKTFAILSKELNVPIIPVAIKGAFESMSTGSFFPKPRKIKLEFLKPIDPAVHLDYNALVELTQSMIKQKVYVE